MVSLVVFAVAAAAGALPADARHGDDTSSDSSDPRIAVHGDDAYVTWVESVNSRFGDVYFVKITGGGSVGEPINVTNGASFYPRPQIRVAGDNVYLLWEDRAASDGNDQMFFAKSSDGGESFSEPITIPEDGGSIYRPFSIHQVNDTVYLFGRNWDLDARQNSVFFVTSNDFGDTFSEPTVLFSHEQSDQGIQVQVHDGTIYVLSDDRSDFDEKGSIYLRKILPDGTLTGLVNVNGGKTAVTSPQLAVSGEDVYVSWRDRVSEKGSYGITERWYPAFTKSHDSGESFDDPIILESDPRSIDTVGMDGGFVFAHGSSVYVLWRSEYHDGTTQSFKTFLAQSHDRGRHFAAQQVPLNGKILERGYILTGLDSNGLHHIAVTVKNPPFNDAAAYFSTSGIDARGAPVDILKGVSTQIGWMPDFESNENSIYFVTGGNNDQNCILYSYSSDGGKSFSDVANISPNGTPKECLGVGEEIESPKKQAVLGVEIEDIRCSEDRAKGYILALRERDGSPICVTSSSYDAMLERKIIDGDSFETLALSAARNYLLSHPEISADIVEDSLELETYMTRHSIPPAFIIRGSFETTSPVYDYDADPLSHDVEITLVQNNKIHLATIDRTHSLLEPSMREEGRPRLGTIVSPTIKTILSPGDRINDGGLIPLVITEVSQGGYPDTAHWTFQSIGYHGGNRDIRWGFLPDQYEINETVDQEGNDAIDRESAHANVLVPGMLLLFPVVCEGRERIEGEAGWHYTLPTRTDTSEVYFRSTDKGIYPDESGVYDIRFVSMFKPEVALLPNMKASINKTVLCPLEEPRNDATHAYYTHLKYRIASD